MRKLTSPRKSPRKYAPAQRPAVVGVLKPMCVSDYYRVRNPATLVVSADLPAWLASALQSRRGSTVRVELIPGIPPKT